MRKIDENFYFKTAAYKRSFREGKTVIFTDAGLKEDDARWAYVVADWNGIVLEHTRRCEEAVDNAAWAELVAIYHALHSPYAVGSVLYTDNMRCHQYLTRSPSQDPFDKYHGNHVMAECRMLIDRSNIDVRFIEKRDRLPFHRRAHHLASMGNDGFNFRSKMSANDIERVRDGNLVEGDGMTIGVEHAPTCG